MVIILSSYFLHHKDENSGVMVCQKIESLSNSQFPNVISEFLLLNRNKAIKLNKHVS
jgi:hypothetical protein